MDTINSKKILIILLLCFIIVTAFRVGWMGLLTTLDYKEQPTVVDGTIDLRGMDFTDKKTLLLHGDWEYSEQQIHNQETESSAMLEEASPVTFDTYKMRILLDTNDKQAFGLYMSGILNASADFVNGQLTYQYAKSNAMTAQYKPRQSPYIVAVTPEDGVIELLIYDSKYTGKGEFKHGIRFGTLEAIQYRNNLSISLQLLVCIVFIIHALYALILYGLGIRNKGLLYFTFIIIFAVFTVLTADDKLLYKWIDINYIWRAKLVFLSYIGAVAFIPAFFNQLLPNYVNAKLLRAFTYFAIHYALFIAVVPISIAIKLSVLLTCVLLMSVGISGYMIRKAMQDKKDVIFLLLACLFLAVNILWSTANYRYHLNFMHYPFDFIWTMLAFATYWFRNYYGISLQTLQLAKQLQLEDMKKDEFLVNTSHELRNPLHSIMNLSQIIADDTKHPIHAEHKKRLETQIQVSKRLSFMLDDLIDVTRLKEKTIQLNLKQVNMKSVATGVADIIKPLLHDKPIHLSIEINEHFPFVWGDENRLVQILYNLLHNAVKYTEAGNITVRATVDHERAHIHIEDTGIGIDEDALQHIFLPYEQASQHAHTLGGFGLGLSISMKLVELHGGTLTVKSTLGSGTTFTFTLPLVDQIEQNDEQLVPSIIYTSSDTQEGSILRTLQHPLSALKRAEKQKILAIDDDKVNVEIIKSIFDNDRFEVVTARTAHQALSELAHTTFDLIISDVMMPHMSGYELTKKVRERFSITELPIILLTARNRSQDKLTAFQAGANDYINKPVDAWELKARAIALLDLKFSIEERLRMESAWLQSQIQPHFLFNTLNSIAALGAIDTDRMQKLLEEFSQYLRLSFDFQNSSPIVSLKHELDLIRSYIYIEKERFEDQLTVEWELSPNLNLYLPPLSIQPLVENAVKHGIRQKVGTGIVCIRIDEQSDCYIVSVTDNGKGMTGEEQQQLFSKDHTQKRRGVGLLNVNRRLKQLYNEELVIESTTQKGTAVSFRIPKMK